MHTAPKRLVLNIIMISLLVGLGLQLKTSSVLAEISGLATADAPLPTAPSSPTYDDFDALALRLQNIARLDLYTNALIKLPDDNNPLTQEDTAIYYVAVDGKRHAFPNAQVYFSWYPNFFGIITVQPNDMASIPLGANATYRPGIKMVKFTTDNRVYAVGMRRTLYPIASEAIAQALYGDTWNRQIDDIPDTFYTDYNIGVQITNAANFNVAVMETNARFLNNVLP